MELYTTVIGLAGRCSVRLNRHALAEPTGDEAGAVNATLDQVLAYGIRSTLGQIEVVLLSAITVRVSLDFDLRNLKMAVEDSVNGVQNIEADWLDR